MSKDCRDNHTSTKTVMEEEPEFIVSGKKALSFFTALFLIAVLFVFPLYYRDYYFDILNAKYQFYYLSVLIMAGCVLATAIIMIALDLTQYRGKYTLRFLGRFALRNLRKTLIVPDIAIICFLLVSIVSTLQSEYLYESFWGNEGRFT